uniref:CSON002000 protein n=1 Tax=Culicoides sonorensis TaxID=179676 RepID=A0A336L1T4_CULSO
MNVACGLGFRQIDVNKTALENFDLTLSENKMEQRSNILDFFNREKYCDVHFSCKSADGKSVIIGAHKLILAASSDVFEAEFFGEIAKNDVVKKEKEISVNDVEANVFKLFLSFIYGKNIVIENPFTLSEFYRVAHLYNCKSAMDFAKRQMMCQLNSQSSTVFYEVADVYDINDLKEACLNVFIRKTSEVLISPEFLAADPLTIEVIFKLENPSINTELDFVYAIERYIEHNKDNADKNVAEKVRPALIHIRFLTLNASDIAKTSLLTPQEIKRVISCLSSERDLSKMPPYLSVNTKRRSSNLKNEKVRLLFEVYNSKTCYRCIKQ